MSRRCDIFKAVDNQWYVLLGNFEHAHELEDCTCYGPFTDQPAADAELEFHSNPGSMWVDANGTRPVPKKVSPPTRKRMTLHPYVTQTIRTMGGWR